MRATVSRRRRRARAGTLGLLLAATTAVGTAAGAPASAQVAALDDGGPAASGSVRTPGTTEGSGGAKASGSARASGAKASGPLIIAHRGAADSAPESTVAAVNRALAGGANAVEVDVRFTRTGYPMVLHDATLDRTTDCSGPITAYSRVELAKCDAGSWFSPAYAGERIPKLDQVVRAVARSSSSAKLLLHVKTLPTTVQAKRIANSVNMHRMMDRTVIIADTDPILAKMATVGFTERGRVFGSPAGWDLKAEYMLPLGIPVDRAAVKRIRDRGGKVWPVESRNLSAPSLLGVQSSVKSTAEEVVAAADEVAPDAVIADGVLVNSLGSVLDLL